MKNKGLTALTAVFIIFILISGCNNGTKPSPITVPENILTATPVFTLTPASAPAIIFTPTAVPTMQVCFSQMVQCEPPACSVSSITNNGTSETLNIQCSCPSSAVTCYVIYNYSYCFDIPQTSLPVTANWLPCTGPAPFQTAIIPITVSPTATITQ